MCVCVRKRHFADYREDSQGRNLAMIVDAHIAHLTISTLLHSRDSILRNIILKKESPNLFLYIFSQIFDHLLAVARKYARKIEKDRERKKKKDIRDNSNLIGYYS